MPAIVRRVRRWEPARELSSIRDEIDHIFTRSFSHDLLEMKGAWRPAMDVYETPDKLTVNLELPGLSAEDVEITVEDSTLTISGEREFNDETERENYHRVERRYGRFERKLALPAACDSGKVEASIADGVLRIDVGKAEEARPRRIEVRAKS